MQQDDTGNDVRIAFQGRHAVDTQLDTFTTLLV